MTNEELKMKNEEIQVALEAALVSSFCILHSAFPT
jgi:hypothetical protein